MKAINMLYDLSILIVLISLLVAMRRMVKGPYTIDRIVALDTITIHTISLIVGIAYLAQRAVYLDIALVYALVSFIGIVGLTRYLIGGLR
ncbi:MAG: monovalent cation/H+ antiporter complex subunit F [Candidatus Cloacimonadaceae bacterium]|nr:monovalent cation/H+ antiporter complex subunit F [Candidatus Cloacimonadaceae bacterium]